ncbi:hypothetical protein BQ8482_60154 [Mesorhizobium delmotii]|uniref:Uncharacterized protein n=1 Tax=Mesorhizobium delmotii TaxID=1631247 RepID=A0A2P9AVB5_9HYPH|nr:hypothetical protein BQ8482_60154 [Mesorhizobium delmotii]
MAFRRIAKDRRAVVGKYAAADGGRREPLCCALAGHGIRSIGRNVGAMTSAQDDLGMGPGVPLGREDGHSAGMDGGPVDSFRSNTRSSAGFMFLQIDTENVGAGCIGGGSGIRTHGGLAPTPVFKTGALNRSAIPPS